MTRHTTVVGQLLAGFVVLVLVVSGCGSADESGLEALDDDTDAESTAAADTGDALTASSTGATDSDSRESSTTEDAGGDTSTSASTSTTASAEVSTTSTTEASTSTTQDSSTTSTSDGDVCDRCVLTEKDSGTSWVVPTGSAATLRLDNDWLWSEPLLSGSGFELVPVDYESDPGYVEWSVTARSSGSAIVVTATGEPNGGASVEATKMEIRLTAG